MTTTWKHWGMVTLLLAITCPGVHIVTAGAGGGGGGDYSLPQQQQQPQHHHHHHRDPYASSSSSSSFFTLGRHGVVWGSSRSSSSSSNDSSPSSSNTSRRRRSTTSSNSWRKITRRRTPPDDQTDPMTRISLTAAASTATLQAPTTTTPTQQQQQQAAKPFVFQLVQQLIRAPAPWQPPRWLRRHKRTATRVNQAATVKTTTTTTTTTTATSLTWPIVDEAAWVGQSGNEFVEDAELVHQLANTGLQVLGQQPKDGNEWVEWKLHSTVKDTTSTTTHNNNNNNNNNDQAASSQAAAAAYDYDTTIDVWTGTSKRQGYGSAAPWIQTRALVPLRPTALVELMLDSGRVKTYNAWSTGRTDLWVATTNDNDDNNKDNQNKSITKIVRNKTQPPMGAKPMVATTLLHAQPYTQGPEGSWLLVSRAVGGNRFPMDKDDDDTKNWGTSEMLLGVNLFEAVPGRPDLTRMTALTHVYSKSIPLMLAERLGVKSAIQFVKDMRALSPSSEQY